MLLSGASPSCTSLVSTSIAGIRSRTGSAVSLCVRVERYVDRLECGVKLGVADAGPAGGADMSLAPAVAQPPSMSRANR